MVKLFDIVTPLLSNNPASADNQQERKVFMSNPREEGKPSPEEVSQAISDQDRLATLLIWGASEDEVKPLRDALKKFADDQKANSEDK